MATSATVSKLSAKLFAGAYLSAKVPFAYTRKCRQKYIVLLWEYTSQASVRTYLHLSRWISSWLLFYYFEIGCHNPRLWPDVAWHQWWPLCELLLIFYPSSLCCLYSPLDASTRSRTFNCPPQDDEHSFPVKRCDKIIRPKLSKCNRPQGLIHWEKQMQLASDAMAITCG